MRPAVVYGRGRCWERSHLGSSSITRHPWVIPVIGCDDDGQPFPDRLSAPRSVAAGWPRRGTPLPASPPRADTQHSAVAAPQCRFVRNDRPAMVGMSHRRPPPSSAYNRRNTARRRSVTPPRLDAWAAYRTLEPTKTGVRGKMTEQRWSGGQNAPRATPPRCACACPASLQMTRLGLGDTIKRVTYAFGLKPCGGCEQRATALNRWVVFTR